MSKLKIYTYPDSVLAQEAQPIDRVEKELVSLSDDMLETMYEAPGIGLAANQVGILKRIIVVDTDYDLEEFPEGTEEDASSEVILNKKPLVMINPKIVHLEGKTEFKEGCLSVPDFQSEVTRAAKIKVEYQDQDGTMKTLAADGIRAVCIQHEIDHLNGKLFIEHLSRLKKEMVKKKLIKSRQYSEDE